MLSYELTDKSSLEKLRIDISPLPAYRYVMVGGALLLLGAAWLVYYALGGSAEISVEEARVHYVRSSISGSIRREFTARANEITDVKIEVIKQFFSQSYEVVLETATDHFTTGFPMLDGDDKHAMAEQIRQALSEPGGSYHYAKQGNLLAIVLLLALGAGAVRLLHGLQVLVVTGRHDIAYLQIRRRLFLLPFVRLGRREIQLCDYRRAKTKKNRPSCNVVIEQKNGKQIPIARDAIFTLEEGQRLAQRIDDWVHQRQAETSPS